MARANWAAFKDLEMAEDIGGGMPAPGQPTNGLSHLRNFLGQVPGGAKDRVVL